MALIDLLGEEPSPREADDVCLLNANGSEEPCETVRPVADPEHLRGVDRLARAGGIPGDHRELVREAFDLWPPSARIVAEPVQQDERWPVTGPLVRDGKTAHLGTKHCGRYPSARASSPVIRLSCASMPPAFRTSSV